VTADPRIVIIGAGPTGIGASWRLAERGYQNWQLVEACAHAGGLASSVVDPQGFTWDLGGHVLFSHYRYFDRLMAAALGDDWVTHEREAWVWMRDRWIPYPFQNNIWRLPSEDLGPCLEGLVEVHRAPAAGPPPNFAEWLRRAFGTGLCEVFMFPYNRKVWGYEPATLDVGWMGERVATVDLVRVLRNLVDRRDDVGWGPNATFRFPRVGGTGAIWRALAAKLPPTRLAFGRRVAAVESSAHRLRFADGSSERYDRLISSMPLDVLLRALTDQPDLAALADRFVYSSSHIVGVGLAGAVPSDLATKCWMYFPEPETPFYRVTVFSNYSPNNVPRPGEQWSLMAEVSESPARPIDTARVVDDVIAGLRRVGLITAAAVVLSRSHTRLSRGYPTPWLGRDEILGRVQPALEALDIYSRGRFGAWRYEVSNQDHSAMQGVEVVDRLLCGAPESTIAGHMGAEPSAPIPCR
jgi:protoporphyrinogen oxidase